ncbi:MAG TPA: bifunctional diaminohydroxyphosphoribosylaminopyrimidine deaminase/5-amino-6-(5-phosphoribosylamino)uracil reductase RibD, partial [Thermoleophilia bacterium]|nr:bifunctional diaminohydroxyphosphoribosylaminopyrimidine deaminase/5-amino-6-(5-phosphoribosylamino)uracil reductase RibD [Thermoleophilia bacterium]
MQRALDLGRLGLGRTSPNPAVGAIIVRDGEIVGEGFTQPAGSWHAEVMALRQAGEKARGATLYCTLEPCCHFGRTPPCTDSIIAAGIAEIHIATLDPNPLIGGKGAQRLEEVGIRIVVGEDQEQARRLIEAFAKHITTGLPFIIAKWAMTLDGTIATRTGDSKWITGEAARERVHQWRDTVDAILVGVDTVIADDPLLTARPSSLHGRAPRPSSKPTRVVADSRCRIPLSAKVLYPELGPGTIIATTELSAAATRERIERTGAQVAVLPSADGRLDLKALVQYLGGSEVTSVLVE